ncbi:TonB-dependent receptor [Sphingobium sp. JS3065]|uniref:TonB-dependent receptor n=1 Tax=Sphingobium sp. JS3065 TaxID=2970925 RepID=UPI0022650C55|nr:TonB-dependent receptor [Sphingobium sp. JS3065]UZW54354.1 TonB-dependent receptor [Sphingobium sp. JS3065]
MRSKVVLLGSVALVGTLGAVSAPARAEASANSAPAGAEQTESTSRKGLQDIIVTARRRSESAQTVPVAVSVASAASLEQHQVLNAYQLVNLTPSLQVRSTNQQTGALNFTIRGIGTSVFGPQVESSVGVVIDDVVMSRPQFGNVQFFDLDRVEVLRGPQGMLFGKNASAGLINIVTAQPRLNRTEFLANIQYGNTTAPGAGNVASLQVAGNMPITGNSALRVSGFVTRQDAVVRDTSLRQNLGNTAVGGRLKFLWEPSDSIRLTVAGDYQNSKGPGEGVLVHRFTAPGGLISTINASNGVFASPKNTSMATDIANTNGSDVYGVSLKAEIELGGGYTLTNVLAHRRAKTNTSIDTDTTTADLFSVNTGGLRRHQTTEELRLTSPADGRFSYQLGLFYLDLNAREFLLQGANLGLPSPGPGLSFLGGYADGTALIKSYAGFFEGQYKLTDSLRVTAGGRYTHDDLRYHLDLTNPAALLPLYGPDKHFSVQTKKDNFSYRFGADYTIAPDVLVYATYSRGYKGPTFDQLTGTLVDPEIPKSYELGVKSTLFDRRLRLNMALFDTTFDGFQTQAQRPGTAAGFMTLNAGQLKSRGVEVEFTALPFDGLTISGGTTFNDTKYVGLSGIPCTYGLPAGTGRNQCDPSTNTTDVSGNQLDNAPRWTTSFTARYERPVSSEWVGFLQGDVYHRSSFYFGQTRDPHLRVGANAIFGLSAGAHTQDDRLSITAFVRNLFDKRVPSYILQDPVSAFYVGPSGVSDAALGGNYWSQFGPNSFRTVGVTVNYRM